MRYMFAIVFASLYGLAIRMLYGAMGNYAEVMSLTFLFLVPGLVGFLTVRFLPPGKPRNAGSAFFLPWLTTLSLLLVTMALSIEGSICWIMIYPFFSTAAGIGGIIAYHLKNKNEGKNDRPNTVNMSILVVLPVVLGLLERDYSSHTTEYTVSEQVVVAATPQQVWGQLTTAETTAGKFKKESICSLLGFPRHLKTTLESASLGGKRTAAYEKGLVLQETITKIDPGKRLVLALKVDPDKIPPTVMDEHIRIGGKHIQILEDTYTLEESPGGKCRLTLYSRFTVFTPFNWYASAWARYVIQDILSNELDAVAERAAGHTTKW